jgi:hypothetical protein
MKKIEKILETNSRIKTAIKYVRRNVKKRLKKIIENEDNSNDESSKKKFFNDEVTLHVSFAETFAKEQVLYKLINLSWSSVITYQFYALARRDRYALARLR